MRTLIWIRLASLTTIFKTSMDEALAQMLMIKFAVMHLGWLTVLIPMRLMEKWLFS